jgi:hypothetical protein
MKGNKEQEMRRFRLDTEEARETREQVKEAIRKANLRPPLTPSGCDTSVRKQVHPERPLNSPFSE